MPVFWELLNDFSSQEFYKKKPSNLNKEVIYVLIIVIN